MPVVQIAVESTGDQAAASTRAEVVHMAGQMDVGESETGPMTDEQVEEGVGDGGEQGSLNVDICKTETVTETHSVCENVCNVIRTPDDQNVISHIVAYTVIENNPSNVQLDMQSDALPDKDRKAQTVEIENTLTTELSSESPTNITRDMVNQQQQQQTDKRTNGRSSGKAAKKEKPTPFKKKDSMAKETLHPNSPTPLSTERCDSSLSNTSMDQCRICQCDSCEIQTDSPLVSPCVCSGSLKFIHQACLQKWIKSSDKMSCELCHFEYQMTKKTKPFREWERLDMTSAERRKVMCSVTFHVIAITCVVWSLYVLIDRTTEEVEAGSLLWPFWTKLIVVAIGFTGGVVFMYVQCKMYLTLCKKWRMYNKVILISSISDAQREKANQEGLLKIKEKQKQLEEGHVTNLDVFNIVNETESV